MSAVLTQRWTLGAPEEMRVLGACLGEQAQSGDIIACCGPLGAGKTTFIQGFATGLAIDAAEYVRSPTFTLMNQYDGRLTLYHFDFYRLDDPWQALDIGFEEYLAASGVVIVEWANKFPGLFPAVHLEIGIDIFSVAYRWVQCTAYDVAYGRYFRHTL